MMDFADFLRGKAAVNNEGDISEKLKDSSVTIFTTKDVKKILSVVLPVNKDETVSKTEESTIYVIQV